mgnify:CR=1 FL=1
MNHWMSMAVAGAAALFLTGTAQADEIFCTGQSGTGLSTVDTDTASGTNVGSTGYSGVWAAAFDNNDGTLYTTVNWGQYLGTINVTTGAVTTIGSAQSGTNLIALECADDGTLYGLDFGAGLWTIDKSTGVRSLVGYGSMYNAMDLAFDSNGTLWAANGNYLYTINTATGASTAVGPITGISGGAVMSITFDENDVLYAMPWTGNAVLYTVDTGTGAATSVGSTGLYYPHGGDIKIDLDTDGDGVNDKDDACIDSDLRSTVWVGDCDSGVDNTLFADGCTIADLVAACAEGVKNHGEFVSCVAALTDDLADDDLITGKEKGKIQSCAGKSDVGK